MQELLLAPGSRDLERSRDGSERERGARREETALSVNVS